MHESTVILLLYISDTTVNNSADTNVNNSATCYFPGSEESCFSAI